MPKRDWLHYLLPVIVALALLGFAYFTQPNALRMNERQLEDLCTQKAYSIETDPEGEPFISVLTQSKPCEKWSSTTDYSEDALYLPRNVNESDLLAQKRMAHWTIWIGVFTAAGLAVLYITFHATRETLVETRKIGVAQTRAYVTVQSAEFIDWKNTQYSLALRFIVKNTGQSAAHYIRWNIEQNIQIHYTDGSTDFFDLRNSTNWDEPISLAPNSEARGLVLLPKSDLIAAQKKDDTQAELFWIVDVFLAWKDVFGEEFQAQACIMTEGDETVPDYRGQLNVNNYPPGERH